MDVEEKNRIARAIERSSVSTQQSVVDFLKLYDVDPLDGTHFSDEMWRMVRLLVSGVAFASLDKYAPVSAQDRYWLDYIRSLSEDDQAMVYWINDKTMRLLSPKGPTQKGQTGPVRDYYQLCRQSKWEIHVPLCIRPANHADVMVGMGAFAMVPLQRGQSICQFTGSLHPMSQLNTVDRGERKNYIIKCQHGIHPFIINPLDDLKTHFGGRINAPSPLAKGSHVRYLPQKSTGMILRYSSKKQSYDVEFADGHVSTAHASQLAPLTHPKKHVANCVWFDFPVPLECYQRVGPDRSGAMLEFALKRWLECTIRLPMANLVDQYELITTQNNGTYPIKKWPYKDVPPNALLTLKPKIYDGLVRQGIVLRMEQPHNTVVIYHRVATNVSWKLPKRMLGGKLKPCRSCTRTRDDPMCIECTVVAFPMIHACSDISVGTELLSFYSEGYVVQSRGSPCAHRLSNETIRPMWRDGPRTRQ